MPTHDFGGPVTNDKTAIYFKITGVTESNNLVKVVADAADADAKWLAVKTWAGADDGNVIRLPAAIAQTVPPHSRG